MMVEKFQPTNQPTSKPPNASSTGTKPILYPSKQRHPHGQLSSNEAPSNEPATDNGLVRMQQTLAKSTVDVHQYDIIVCKKTPLEDTGDVDPTSSHTRAAQCSREAIRVAKGMVGYPQTLDHAPPGTLDGAAVSIPVSYRSWGRVRTRDATLYLESSSCSPRRRQRPISGGVLCSQRVGSMVVSRPTPDPPGPIWVWFRTFLFTCYVEESAGSRPWIVDEGRTC